MQEPAFTISPSEAFLLGCFWEQYLQASRANPETYFLDAAPRWFNHFNPTFRNEHECREITDDELPDRISWNGDSIPMFGYSGSTPNRTYHRTEDGNLTVLKYDNVRRSFLDLIINEVGTCVAKSHRDRCLFPDDGDCAKAWFELWKAKKRRVSFAEFPQMTMTRNGEDDVSKIERQLQSVVDKNECTSLFSLGREFGAILSTAIHCERELTRYFHESEDDYDEDNYFDDMNGIMSGCRKVVTEKWELIIKHPLARNYGLAGDANDLTFPGLGILRNSGEIYVSVNDSQIDICEYFDELWNLRTKVWCTIGFTLGALRDADIEHQTADAARITPRAFQCIVNRNASIDEIADAINRWDRLTSDVGTDIHPKDVITGLSACIEVLVQRCWRNEIDKSPYTSNFSRLLGQKLKSIDNLEQKFAQIAMTFYRQYRNPAQHEFESFACAWHEARLFIMAMKTLLELSREIRSQNN